MKKAWNILKGTLSDFSEDRALRLSAAMAYYAIFSIGPLLVLAVGVAGLVMGEENVRQEIGRQLQGLVGDQSAKLVESMMESRKQGVSLLATILGAVGLFLGAAGVFGQLQDALNTIWEVQPKPGRGIRGFIRDRFLSMTMVLGTGFLLLVSMVLTALINALAGYIGQMVSMPPWIARIADFTLALGLITVLFALIFKVLPDVKIRWSDVWVGAFCTALLFSLGKFLLGWYLGRESTTSAYGAGSAFVVILLYIYYSSVILFLGAEFTQVYAKTVGSRIVPSENAEPVTREARAQQGMPDKTEGKRAPTMSARPFTQPVASYSSPGVHMQKHHSQPSVPVAAPRPTPGQSIRSQPWSFMGIALAAGAAVGLLLRFRVLRKGLKYYLAARRFV